MEKEKLFREKLIQRIYGSKTEHDKGTYTAEDDIEDLSCTTSLVNELYGKQHTVEAAPSDYKIPRDYYNLQTVSPATEHKSSSSSMDSSNSDLEPKMKKRKRKKRKDIAINHNTGIAEETKDEINLTKNQKRKLKKKRRKEKLKEEIRNTACVYIPTDSVKGGNG